MVVIGIDFGNESCVVSVWRNGRIEIVTNDLNFRCTPSMVAFSQRNRNIGVSAKKQWSDNVANTIFDFKNLLNENWTRKWKFDLLKFTENPKDLTLSFDITMLGQKFKFSPCQVLAMLLTKIKADAQAFIKSSEKIIGCVIAVPSYFNDQERKAVLMAAAIARLDCHFLIKETTAVAINYSVYKKFTTPVNVIFIDFGQSSIQISACKFSDRQLEVIEEVSELIGGRDLDETLADYFIDSFKIRGAYKKSKIFSVQLLHEVEELKKKMSTNAERLPLNFKQLFNCEQIFMDRAEMEKVCAPIFEKIENLMRLCLERSKLKFDEIHSIEMVGGSSRIPIIVNLAEKVFGKVPTSTMNCDDAVARGCLLKYILSIKQKSYRIKEKPRIDDALNNFNLSCSAMKDYVRVFQVHRYLKCDCRESFNVTENEFMEYVEIEKKLGKYDIDEVERRAARDKLDKFLAEHMKPDGLLANTTNSEVKKELTETRMWHYGSKDQYQDLLDYWIQKVEKIKKRKLMEQHKDCDCAAKHLKTLQSNVNQVIVKKLTFNDCCKIIPIEDDRSSNSEPGPRRQPSKSSSRNRKGLRRLRLNHHLNNSQGPGLADSRSDGSRYLLLNGKRKTRMNWCCFL